MAFAAERGMRAEVVAVLDRPDAATRSLFRAQADLGCYEVDFGDSGLARNFGVQQSRGRYVNYLDGGDLLSRSWLWEAFVAAESASHRTVWTPQISLIFDHENIVWRHPSSDDPDFRPESLISSRRWFSSLLVPRRIALEYPFIECGPDSGFGLEDWHWHCELLADGISIRAVEGTTYFHRRRPGSHAATQLQRHAIHRPSRLFDFSGMRRFGLRPGFPAIGADHVVKDPWLIEASGPIEPPIAGHRSPLKVAYASIVRPCLPAAFDVALKRLYFATFPSGIRHWTRNLRGAASTLARALGRRAVRGVKRVARALIPASIRAEIRALRHGTAAQQPTNPHSPNPADILPGWLLADWRDIHTIEPQLFPSSDQLSRARLALEDDPSPVGAAYVDACCRIGEPWPSHVFLVPWLTTGGSDLTALNYVHALHAQGQADRIVVLATEDRDSTWTHRLPPGTTFLPLGQLYRHLTFKERKALLVRLLLQMRPRMIHNLNSLVGSEAFVSHGKALAAGSILLGHLFCYDLTREGQRVGYPVDHAPRYFDFVSALISDNRTLLEEMQELYGLDPARLVAHYQPVLLKERRVPRIAGSRGPLKILWAGRLDYQKRVDILNAIAVACADDDFEIHAYGSHVLDRDTPLPHGPHLTFHGPYDGFESLPAHEFDVFLYTSQWDGLPNVLQEAMSRGLVVVASGAGGAKELIRTGETGYLIEPFDNVPAFVEAIRSIDRDRSGAARMASRGYQRLLDQHSPERFARAVAETPGYRPTAPLRRDITAA
ncbi:glycosyltransferase family 4 protein [Aquisphaera insulae]|uniref:glycosyltransferase family 4 protein n=1 Tax=Aquisphaera insulae TaxID=2712864 RepID=UPI0013ECB5C1|nr:glycosyltransferase family 4 protein [Aquisphaera insulae]